MITIEEISPQRTTIYKAARLRALQESPWAFGSTYARESTLSDADWEHRAIAWNNGRSIGYVALDGDEPCGIVGVFLHENDVAHAHLVSMWVAPAHRRLGLGRSLVDKVVAWCCGQGVHRLTLHVTSNNDAATRFYERLGFAKTGRAEPYANDPSQVQYEMCRHLLDIR